MTTVLMLALLLATTPDGDQRRVPGAAGPENQVSAAIAMTVGSSAYNFTGPARCEHLPKGSIYSTVAERWSVNHDENGRRLVLNVWRPLAGGENLITLYVSTAGRQQVMNTAAPEKKGAGSVTFVPEGKGGTFTIKGSTDSGATISGTIRCEAFTPAEVVAG